MSESAEKQEKNAGMEKYFFRASAEDFKKIPGSPIAYWASSKFLSLFKANETLRDYGINPATGLQTGDNSRFIRCWFEVSDIKRGKKWISLNDGGDVRKWYGNFISCIDWENDGMAISAHKSSVIRNAQYYFREGATWNRISSAFFAIRYLPEGFIFDQAGDSLFTEEGQDLFLMIGFLNSPIGFSVMKILCPTLNATAGSLELFPYPETAKSAIGDIRPIITNLIGYVQADWNSHETSWDFTTLPLLHPDYLQPTLQATYQKLRAHWQEMTLETQRLEEENNRIFIEAYGLQDELTPEVPLNEITLTCNPYYRYKKAVSNQLSVDSKKNGGEAATDNCTLKTGNSAEGGTDNFPFDNELEALLLADTMKEFISYSVGCMFGRYSLDAPGLILANQGETLEDYFRIVKEKQERPEVISDEEVVSCQLSVVSEKSGGYAATDNCKLITDNSAEGGTDNSKNIEISFPPDADNVIPILGDNWFVDDIAERFRCFLRTTFGEKHYEENLKFIEDAIGKDIRKYFLKNFYTDHVKRYKKRPIYWLFSSPRGSFNALIYMHRYQPDTVSIILNDYLREFRTKLIARREHLEQVSISASAKKTEKTRALKEIEKLKKTIEELDTYENEILYPLATQKIEIDLDDGVKVNYKKFGKALKKVPGLSA